MIQKNNLIIGTVVTTNGKNCKVNIKGSDLIVDCVYKGNFKIKNQVLSNPVATGDIVEFTNVNSIGLITKIHKRKNYLIRKAVNLTKQEQMLLANFDQLIIMITYKYPNIVLGFLDRILITCESYSIEPIILVNKIDLLNQNDQQELDLLLDYYKKIGYNCIKTSIFNKINLNILEIQLKGKISGIIGQSGVGKSSLINYYSPNSNLKVKEISTYNEKGTHSTTFSCMHKIDEVTYLIDTPGIKMFGFIEFDKNLIKDYFKEFNNLSKNCKFYNCKHINEPKCAVINALECGNILNSRYQNYLRFYNEEKIKKNWK